MLLLSLWEANHRICGTAGIVGLWALAAPPRARTFAGTSSDPQAYPDIP